VFAENVISPATQPSELFDEQIDRMTGELTRRGNWLLIMIVLDVEDAEPLTVIVGFDSQGKRDLLIETDESFASSAALIFELFSRQRQ
jgi:hypothetical protein